MPRLVFARVALLLALLVVGSFVPIRPAYAANFVVDSTTDAVDANPGDTVCATAPLPNEGVRCTLRAAIMEANAEGGSHSITVPAGTYGLSSGGPFGRLFITVPLTITGASAATTIVDGNPTH